VIIAAKLQIFSQKINDTEAIQQCLDKNLYYFLKTSNYTQPIMLSGDGLIEMLINDVDCNFLCYSFGRFSRSWQYYCG
jgi:hypothetical protein